MRLEWTRVVPAADVPKLKLGPLYIQSFPLPEGARLVVFTSQAEADSKSVG